VGEGGGGTRGGGGGRGGWDTSVKCEKMIVSKVCAIFFAIKNNNVTAEHKN